MSGSKFCYNCGNEIEAGTKFCPHCGANQLEFDSDQTSTREEQSFYDIPRGADKRALDHITIGYQVAFEQPMVFLPPIISGLLGAITSYGLSNIGFGEFSSMLIGLILSIFSFILNFASIDMSRDAYYKQPLDLMESVGYTASRFFVFFLAAIFGGLLSITIVLIPVVLFMFVIMVMDETGIMDAFQKALSLIRSDLMDVLAIIVISIVASLVISFIPYISTLLNAVINVILGIAYIDIYATFKKR
jgi:hypothetical protein